MQKIQMSKVFDYERKPFKELFKRLKKKKPFRAAKPKINNFLLV